MQWTQLSSNKLVACECSLKVLVHLPSCHELTLELLQDRVTIFAEMFGMSVVANDQYASLTAAEKRKKQQLSESHKILKPKYKTSGELVVTFSLLRRRNLPHTPPILSYATATNNLNIDQAR